MRAISIPSAGSPQHTEVRPTCTAPTSKRTTCKKVSRKRKKLTCSPKVLRLTAPADEPTDSLVLDARLIRKRVDSMTKMLESCVSKASSDHKARLREEMKCLIEKVAAASDKVRLMAEKSSS
ncbi:hypothetical protein SASPL_157807 [Salvia splendens]|uniref:Uncharacterized protein n=1 Tax=Salvia splendens TaxID=180675 RepID=A0A8X8VUC1_SALSN|nr:hypothetical protein SASPL_157807 [Salvia splendens]